LTKGEFFARRNFRHASLDFLEIKQLFLRKSALPAENFAQNPNISTLSEAPSELVTVYQKPVIKSSFFAISPALRA